MGIAPVAAEIILSLRGQGYLGWEDAAFDSKSKQMHVPVQSVALKELQGF
jgi:hypothetical protein